MGFSALGDDALVGNTPLRRLTRRRLPQSLRSFAMTFAGIRLVQSWRLDQSAGEGGDSARSGLCTLALLSQCGEAAHRMAPARAAQSWVFVFLEEQMPSFGKDVSSVWCSSIYFDVGRERPMILYLYLHSSHVVTPQIIKVFTQRPSQRRCIDVIEVRDT